jgi:hypothetical protein
LFFAPLLFGSDIYQQQVTTFSTLVGVGMGLAQLQTKFLKRRNVASTIPRLENQEKVQLRNF